MDTSEAIYYLTHDENGESTAHLLVPCSRYGDDCAECAPVAVRLAEIFADANGDEITPELLDELMSAVVNDSDDVASLLAEHAEPSVCAGTGYHENGGDCDECNPGAYPSE